MAPDIRQQAETGQTIAATPAAPLIVASTPPRQHTQRHSIQNYYIPKWRLTFRVKLNVIATTSSATLFARRTLTHIDHYTLAVEPKKCATPKIGVDVNNHSLPDSNPIEAQD